MQRRSFIRNTLTVSTGLFLFPNLAKTGQLSSEWNTMDADFLHPPDEARPWVFWQWMNGNITKEGITADLETMKRMGIGGALCFNNAVGIPRGPVDYASEVWMDATVHAATEAQRLGLVLSIHNSPGYSGCGGPWITPDKSMQQLVWTETLVDTAGNVDVLLPKPYAKRHYYKEAFVIAYPSLPVEKGLMKETLQKILVNGKEIDKAILTDGSPETRIRLEPSGKEAILLLQFAEPFEARAITILRKPETPHDLFDGPRDHPPVFRLESADDGINFTFIGTIRNPELREMDTPTAFSFAPVKARYYRLVANTASWFCNVELHNGPRLGGWPGKTSHTHGDVAGETPAIEKELYISGADVRDISTHMDSNGRLQWNTIAGRYTILRIGHTTTGEEPAAHPDTGKGLEIDKFSKEALELHFTAFLDKLLHRLQPMIGKSFRGITVDSWEAGKQNWTANFPAHFKQYVQYDIIQWMPALTGRIVNSVDATERFLWDVRKTQAHLLAENFYGHFYKLCHDRGLEFYAEPYGDGNFDSLEVSQHMDITMSEFWTRYIYGSDVYSKQAVSAAHAYGKKIVAAESFTAMPATAKWTDYPYSLKAEGDYFYTLGVNRLTFHVFVHQPYMTGKPGMTMGPFGMHIDRNNTWTEQAHGWTSYLQRTQYLLQQGLMVADVCYFKGDTPESGVPDIYRQLPAGYAGDMVDAYALQTRFNIVNNKIALPDGMQYRICILAPSQTILPGTLTRIATLVAAGMVLVVSTRPSRSYGLTAKDDIIQQLTNELFGNLDGNNVTQRNYGKGTIIWSNNWKQILDQLNIQPDFTYTAANQDATIHYVHKVIGDQEFYFISNHRRRQENIVISLRISGKQPEIANPETGAIIEAVLYETVDGRINMPLTLEPAGSIFILFRKKQQGEEYHKVVKEATTILTTKPFAAPQDNLYAAIQNNFTIACWAKPDTFAHGGRSMLFHPPAGEVVYGVGHAAVGLAAGQNAIRVYERSTGPTKEALAYNGPIEGWTHIAVVYTSGAPVLYLNGKVVATGTASGKTVHPGIGTVANIDQFASYFEGNYTTPQLLNHPLTSEAIQQLFKKGLPAAATPSGIVLKRTGDGKYKALIWENGHYTLTGPQTTKSIEAISGCAKQAITGDWQVKFPVGSGAPAQITLPALISLHKHADFNVKHFSGTCIYTKIITVTADMVKPGKKLFLHLGRVEVIAEITLNGKKLDLLWKEPFMAEITSAVKTGSNKLEIAVTNLWPNRLIGDEQLPVENEYSEHGFIKKFPDWYVNNQPKPGQRRSFAVWHTYGANDPLFESGLLGPVFVVTAIEKTFT